MENKKPKEKRRNSERRKEKSRDAARCRRSKETEIFTDLGSALPLAASVISQLDKATVMRLTIASFKIMNALSSMDIDERPLEKQYPPNMNEICNKALDGIVIILTADGDIIFISENVSSYLGLSQIDLIGQSIYDFSHLCDHTELKEILTGKDVGVQKSFFIRMKSTVTNKGRSVNLKSASYKVLHFTGHTVVNTCVKHELSVLSADDDEYDSDYESEQKPDTDSKSNVSDDSKRKKIVANDLPSQIFVTIAEPIPHPANVEIPLYKKSKIFFSKHSLDMKYIIADDVITKFLGYEPDSLVSKSVFDYYHAQDCNSVEKSFKILFQKGQVETNRYRFLSKGGGYVWVVTQATILNDCKGQTPESIMCINYIVSGVEHGDEIYSLCQVPESPVAEQPAVVEDDDLQQQPGASPRPESPLQRRPSAGVAAEKKPSCGAAVKAACAPDRRRPVDSAAFLLPAGDGPVGLRAVKLMKPPARTAAAAAAATTATTASFIKKKPAPCSESPKAATATIFAPRTKDMNKGFLTFSDDDTGLTMLKDEPEDLTHLAPTAGDVCVPLDTYVPMDTCGIGHLGFVMSDVLDDLILTDCSLAPFDSMPSASSLHDAYSSTCSSSPMRNAGDDQLSQHAADLCDPTMSTLLGMDLDNGHSDMDLDLSLKNQFIPFMYEDDLYPLLTGDLLWGGDRSPSPKPAVITSNNNNNNNNWHLSTTENVQDNKDAMPLTPKIEVEENTVPRQQHFDSGGGGGKHLMDGGRDSWGSISKMLHQRYNSGTEATADDAPAACRTNGVKRLQEPNATSAPASWKRSKQEETAKQGASNSVLMNLLVSGCDDGGGAAAGKTAAGKKATSPTALSRGKCGTARPRHRSRLKSSCLLDPGSAAIPSLMDLTEHDYDVNAPADEGLLQGSELLMALDAGGGAGSVVVVAAS